jgi:hypothetical protein
MSPIFTTYVPRQVVLKEPGPMLWLKKYKKCVNERFGTQSTAKLGKDWIICSIVEKNADFFHWKSAKIAEISNHNIDPTNHETPV